MRRAVVPAAAVLTIGVAVSACGTSSGSSAPVTLTGAGSTAQQAAMQAWQAAYGSGHSNVTINYTPNGSGAGLTSFFGSSSDFAGTDAALNPAKGEIDKAKQRCGGDVIEVPDYVSPVAVIFTLSGVTSLNLDASTTAQIFAGKITKWNDPAIKALNPTANLPATDINTVHRSDASGTTNNFTDYLNKAAATDWSHPANTAWPFQSGEGAPGNSGVVAAVKSNGSIGYADFSQAKGVTLASIKVGSDFVQPSADGAAKALAASPLDSTRGANDIVVKLDRTTTAAGAYPIALVSYLVACPTYSGASKADALKGFLGSIVSGSGQATAATSAGSAPLPSALESQVASVIAGIKSK